MDRLFLDANVLFSAAYRPDAGLLHLWKLKNVALCSSRYAVEEARFNLDDDDQRARLVTLTQRLYLFEAAAREMPNGVSLPEKDAPILLAAIQAGATHLLTGDIRHFGPHFGHPIAGISIVLPGEYLRAHTGHSRKQDT
jgi:predicted nucleic acid-binding protein